MTVSRRRNDYNSRDGPRSLANPCLYLLNIQAIVGTFNLAYCNQKLMASLKGVPGP